MSGFRVWGGGVEGFGFAAFEMLGHGALQAFQTWGVQCSQSAPVRAG